MICSTLLCLLAAVICANGEPRVVPKYQQLKIPGTAVIECKFPRPLTDCRIRASDHYNRTFDTILNFGLGRQSNSVTLKTRLGGARAAASYAGNGLAAGHCGVKLRVEGFYLSVLVECFGQSKEGSWSKGFGLLTTDTDKVLSSLMSLPRLVVTNPGSNLAVHFRIQGKLNFCYVLTPFVWGVNLSPGKTPPHGSRYRALDTGPEQGECGAELTDLQPADAGLWSWWANRLSADSTVFQAVVVLVAVPPVGEPTLSVHNPYNLKEGDELQVTCRAQPSVPAASLTWLLDGKVIRRDKLNDTLYGDVGAAQPWQPQANVQTLSYRLARKNRGKRLQCRVEHPTWNSPQSVSMLLDFAVSERTVLDCGERGYKPTLIAGGKQAAVGEFPWHVGVYKANEQICGGTLVSKKFAISAAHCFWDDQQLRLKSHTLFKLAAGKLQSALVPLEKDAQVRDVAKIHIPRRYRDRSSYYQYDIAVVQVTRAFVWKLTVKAICINWDGKYQVIQPPFAVIGTVVGWGLTLQTDDYSPVLKKINLPYVGFDTCFNALSENVKKLFTEDKFCAGFVSKSQSVCQGDSGGGLVFPHDDRYFLQGVVSVNFQSSRSAHRCFAQMYTGFTNVSNYLPWITKIVNP